MLESRRNRVCSICEESKPLVDFEKMPKKKFGRGYRCNLCNRERARVSNSKLIRPIAKCVYCITEFHMANKNHIHCSTSCRNFSSFKTNEHKYITALLTKRRKDDGLTRLCVEELLEAQSGLCALSGVPMTMVRGSGSIATNLSLDRIEAGGTYAKHNIQLVCSAVNSFRRDLTVGDYIEWCAKVVSTAKEKRC